MRGVAGDIGVAGDRRPQSGLSEQVQSRSDLAHVVCGLMISPISLAYVAATAQVVPSQFSQLAWMSRIQHNLGFRAWIGAV